MKIYIIPTGWDRELVIKTVFKSAADKVCLISAFKKKAHTYSQADSITKEVNAYLIQELSKFTKIDTLEVNYIDFKDIVTQINKYIKENEGHEFIINISTGSHMLAASLMFVAYLKHIDIEYSIAENHNPQIMDIVQQGGGYHCGFMGILKIPSIPFSFTFSVKEKNLLMRLKESGTLSVKDFVSGVTGNSENRLRSEFHYLCKKLEKQGFVSIRTKGKLFEVKLTPFAELCI